MKLASWNVNSIKARKDNVLTWLHDNPVDVLCMQELKGLDFPAEDFEALGYQVETVGQKSYNGVAVLSRSDISVIHTALPSDDTDDQARYLECDIDDIRLINIYLPNGNPVDTDKFDYKLGWMQRLLDRIEELRQQRIPFLIGGDFNVIPTANDTKTPEEWENDALYRAESKGYFRRFLNSGLVDAYRTLHPLGSDCYTFWDYQAGAWPRNNGIRIDHWLLSPAIADRLQSCTIDKTPRGQDKPSDHTPIVIEI